VHEKSPDVKEYLVKAKFRPDFTPNSNAILTELDLVHMWGREGSSMGIPPTPPPRHSLNPSTPFRAPLRWARLCDYRPLPLTQKAMLLPSPTPRMNEALQACNE